MFMDAPSSLARKQPSITSFKTSFDKSVLSGVMSLLLLVQSADVVGHTEQRIVLRLTSAREPLIHVHVCCFPTAAANLSTMVQEYQSPVRVYKHPFELIMAVSLSVSRSVFVLCKK